jgi:hypothetical protein
MSIQWLIPLSFWLSGLLIAGSPGILFRKFAHEKGEVEQKARTSRKRHLPSKLFFTIEKNAMDMIPWWLFTLICTILSLILITFGFFSIGFLL